MDVIEIVEYDSTYKEAFKELNIAWIQKYFKMEEADYKALDNPEESILNPGGAILIALCNDETAGVCALIKSHEAAYDYELAKMAVSPKFQGKGIGYLLGNATIEKAKTLNGTNIYLESNTILTPAINLYRKLGFKEVKGLASPYKRSNIKMEILLK